MSIVLSLSPNKERVLQESADRENCSVEAVAKRMLEQAIDDKDADRRLRETVAAIKSRPKNGCVQRATASLAELLKYAREESPIDVEQWNRDWAKFEAEMKGMDAISFYD